MSTTLAAFSFGNALGTSPTVIAQTNTSQKAFIGNVTLTNTTESDVEVYIWRLLTATTPTTGISGNWLERVTVPAGKVIKLTKLIGHTLNPAMSITGQAAIANAVNYDGSGTIET